MPKYLVKSPLKFNSDDLAEGDTVEMPEKAAKELIDAGVLEKAKGKADN